jgi:hypothetical protein
LGHCAGSGRPHPRTAPARGGAPAQEPAGALPAGRQIGLFHLVCYLRDGDPGRFRISP